MFYKDNMFSLGGRKMVETMADNKIIVTILGDFDDEAVVVVGDEGLELSEELLSKVNITLLGKRTQSKASYFFLHESYCGDFRDDFELTNDNLKDLARLVESSLVDAWRGSYENKVKKTVTAFWAFMAMHLGVSKDVRDMFSFPMLGSVMWSDVPKLCVRISLTVEEAAGCDAPGVADIGNQIVTFFDIKSQTVVDLAEKFGRIYHEDDVQQACLDSVFEVGDII